LSGADALPSVLWGLFVPFRLRKSLEVAVKPVQPVPFLELIVDAFVDLSQIDNVIRRIIELRLGQGAFRPITTGLALFKLDPQQLFDEARVSDLLEDNRAEARRFGYRRLGRAGVPSFDIGSPYPGDMSA